MSSTRPCCSPNPKAVTRFDEHSVILPLVVISELEGKRHHHELGWFAREALRHLDDLRLEYGRLDEPIPIGECGGTLQVELNHTDPRVLPSGFRTDDNDSRILACALNLRAEGRDVTLVTKDTPLRVKAGAVGLAADEYHAQDVVVSGWTGMTELEVTRRRSTRSSTKASSTSTRHATCRATPASGCSADGRAHWAGSTPRSGCSWCGATARHLTARAFGRAARRAGLAARRQRRDRVARWQGGHRKVGARAVRRPGGGVERRTHRKVVVFRPLYAVGGSSSVTCRAARPTRWGPGRRRYSTRWRGWRRRRSSTRSPRAACSRCCH